MHKQTLLKNDLLQGGVLTTYYLSTRDPSLVYLINDIDTNRDGEGVTVSLSCYDISGNPHPLIGATTERSLAFLLDDKSAPPGILAQMPKLAGARDERDASDST